MAPMYHVNSNHGGLVHRLNVENKASRVWCKSGLSRKDVNEWKGCVNVRAPFSLVRVPPQPPLRQLKLNPRRI